MLQHTRAEWPIHMRIYPVAWDLRWVGFEDEPSISLWPLASLELSPSGFQIFFRPNNMANMSIVWLGLSSKCPSAFCPSQGLYFPQWNSSLHRSHSRCAGPGETAFPTNCHESSFEVTATAIDTIYMHMKKKFTLKVDSSELINRPLV